MSRPKCTNCGMYSPGFRKDGFTKIFENSLTDKQITNNRVKGLQRPDMIKKNAGNGNGNSSSTGAASDLPNIKHKGGSKYVLSTEVRNILRSLFHKEQAILQKFSIRDLTNTTQLVETFFQTISFSSSY